MPGAGRAHGPPAAKKAGGSHHRSAETSGIPCAMGLRLIRTLPGERAFLPPSPARREKRLRKLSASVAAPGPYDFAVREGLAPAPRQRTAAALAQDRSTSLVVTTSSRPPHPAPRVVTTRTPLFMRRNGADKTTDLGVESRLFLKSRRRRMQTGRHDGRKSALRPKATLHASLDLPSFWGIAKDLFAIGRDVLAIDEGAHRLYRGDRPRIARAAWP
jgi:hypothetical protein